EPSARVEGPGGLVVAREDIAAPAGGGQRGVDVGRRRPAAPALPEHGAAPVRLDDGDRAVAERDGAYPVRPVPAVAEGAGAAGRDVATAGGDGGRGVHPGAGDEGGQARVEALPPVARL